ncbi:sporulation protein YpjB [Brevibacillus sp. B_LB10_24]|uniref:sporulation protein YpjB n=1 Tax=Brevibacillus sp. B_LB10_24 TaxID=3380645 RepID=UPI0038BB2922
MRKKSTKILILLCLAGFLLAWPISYFFAKLEKPTEEANLTQLDRTAQEFLSLTMKGDLDNARLRVIRLAEMFPSKAMPLAIRIESLNAVTQSILAAKKEFASPKPSEEVLIWHATRVRVTIDALRHASQPMWRTYFDSYAAQMQHLMQSSVERDIESFRQQFEEYKRLFLVIRPAMSVQLKESLMEKIDNSYELLTREIRNATPDWQIARDALRELNSSMQEAFFGEDRSALARFSSPNSPLLLILAVAGVLTITLGYVAWRKYLAEQERFVS